MNNRQNSEGITLYENRELVGMTCKILRNKFVKLIQAIDDDVVPVTLSETTMENYCDVVLENDDFEAQPTRSRKPSKSN